MIDETIKQEIDRKRVSPEIFRKLNRIKRRIPIEGNLTKRFYKLRAYYNEVTKELNMKYDFETRVTYHEQVVLKLLQKITRAKFIPQFWVGNHCYDLFMPRYSIGIEVNGGIHYREFKMRKDNLRDENSAFINIPIYEIPHDDIVPHMIRVMTHLKNNERPHQTYERRNIARNAYLFTILRHKGLNFDISELDNVQRY